MDLALDHIVHFVHRAPAEATEQFRAKGYHAVAGGRHAMWGTWNSLSYFGLTYVEFLAVEREALAKESENPLIRQLVADQKRGEGLGQIALRTRQMDEWANRLRQTGMTVTGPVAGSRMREDGSTIRWRMLFLDDPDSALQPPFLIEWEESDEERVKDLTSRGVIAPHANGAKSIQSVCYAVSDLEEAAGRWQLWFGWESSEVFTDEQLEAKCRQLEIPGSSITLCQPVGSGQARNALQARGERPFAVKVCTESKEAQDVVLGGMYTLLPC